jgi:hypothetical protein
VDEDREGGGGDACVGGGEGGEGLGGHKGAHHQFREGIDDGDGESGEGGVQDEGEPELAPTLPMPDIHDHDHGAGGEGEGEGVEGEGGEAEEEGGGEDGGGEAGEGDACVLHQGGEVGEGVEVREGAQGLGREGVDEDREGGGGDEGVGGGEGGEGLGGHKGAHHQFREGIDDGDGESGEGGVQDEGVTEGQTHEGLHGAGKLCECGQPREEGLVHCKPCWLKAPRVALEHAIKQKEAQEVEDALWVKYHEDRRKELEHAHLTWGWDATREERGVESPQQPSHGHEGWEWGHASGGT